MEWAGGLKPAHLFSSSFFPHFHLKEVTLIFSKHLQHKNDVIAKKPDIFLVLQFLIHITGLWKKKKTKQKTEGAVHI